MDSASKVALVARAVASQGSAREGGSNSASGILSTLIPALIIATVAFTGFLILRSKSERVYSPRGLPNVVPKGNKTPSGSTSSLFGWLEPYKSHKDTHVLQHHSLDGYLWLRFLRSLAIICAVGACITWPILFPVNATGGGGKEQLDKLSLSNILNPNRFYAHALVAWIFQGFVVYTITKERLFFIGLRQAYFMSPLHSLRLSSRTVLFMTIPDNVLNINSLRELFGSHVRKVWLVPDCKKLEKLVEDRDKEWARLEKAQVKVAKQVDKLRIKKKLNTENPLKDVKTPTHRTKPIIGKKVETIPHSRSEMVRLGKEIQQLREQAVTDGHKKTSSAFIEFSSQLEAQRAFQSSINGKKTEWKPRYIGVQPDEVIWKNMNTSYTVRKSKMLIVSAIITVMIIFWAIPVAFVGVLSNVNNLTNMLPWLGFINNIPAPILGLVTSLLPVILLAVLMALVPIICRLLAKFAGAATLGEVELKTQTWYFAFQVVQVFLITTFTSAAASVVTDIISNPGSAVTLLSTNLPTASNFFISYIILQGLSVASMQLLAIVPYLLFVILGSLLDSTPRKKYNRWMKLAGLAWGTFFPVWTNLGVIALSYSCIAPLILVFAAIGFYLVYLAFRYKFLFVLGIQADLQGAGYAKALNQLLTGVYLSTICLLGLFAINIGQTAAAVGPFILMVIFLVVLIVYHVLLNVALKPLEESIPLHILEEDVNATSHAARVEEGLGDKVVRDVDQESTQETIAAEDDTVGKSHGHTAEKTNQRTPQVKQMASSEHKTGNFLTRRILPHVTKSFDDNKALLLSDHTLVPEHYTAEDVEMAYQHPALKAIEPIVWIAKDDSKLSEKFIRENREAGIQTSDDRAWFDEKGKLQWDSRHVHKCPIFEDRKHW